jgi:hypothetical protein
MISQNSGTFARSMQVKMKQSTITDQRLIAQQIFMSPCNSPKEIVSWMGAMQGQDFNMCKAAVGLRINGCKESMVDEALDKGEILRTHVLRPTWHLVAREDIHWMLDLSATRIKASAKGMHQQLEITPDVLKKSTKLLEKLLTQKKNATRSDIITILTRAKIAVNKQRLSYLLLWAELDKLICSGETVDKKLTYSLFNERVPNKRKLIKDEALAALASRYFNSRGPATLPDFTWWSGLTITESRHALELVRPQLSEQKINGQVYWSSSAERSVSPTKNSLFLLPAFDEYIIAYKDRSAVLPDTNNKNVIGANGLFRPVIIYNGNVTGIWSRTIKGNTVFIKADFFETPTEKIKKLTKSAAQMYSKFLDKEPVLSF